MQSLSEYMADCLYNPTKGFYMKGDVVGANGSFTTSPEISQFFGEIIAFSTLNKLQAGQTWHLVECGPGRGTLMYDMLKLIQKFPILNTDIQVHMVEISPGLKAEQQDKLKEFKDIITWHETLDFLEELDGPIHVVANEYLDAFPTDQYRYESGAWQQHYVDNGTSVWQPGTPPADLLELYPQPNDGDILESMPLAETEFAKICTHVRRTKGSAVFIDYGYFKSQYGDSFQALKDHAPISPFEAPYESDLTVHINFERFHQLALAADLNGNVQTQADYLGNLQIHAWAAKVYENATTEQVKDLKSGLDRLMKDMGNLFKVLEINT